MAKKPVNRGLGRGLSALLGDDAVAPAASQSAPRADDVVAIDLIRPNPDQPRKIFDEDDLADLAASIRAKGVIQPLIVRRDPGASEAYQIVAGERRWRAAQIAKLHELPIVLRDLTDTEVLELAIIENVQRADLNAADEAEGYAQLMRRFGHTQEQLSDVIGKSRSYIANAVRLLTLPAEVLDHVRAGRLSAGHARALVTADQPAALARVVIGKKLSVRQLETLMKAERAPKPAAPTAPDKDADTKVLEADLSAALGLRVAIDHKQTGGGSLQIRYKNLEELDGICQLLNRTD